MILLRPPILLSPSLSQQPNSFAWCLHSPLLHLLPLASLQRHAAEELIENYPRLRTVDIRTSGGSVSCSSV